MSYRGRVIRTWAAGVVLAGIVGLGSPGRAGAQQAPTTPPYSFNLFGLINVGKFTDVTLTVKPTSTAPLPPTAKQIQLQAYTPDGKKLIWKKNYADYPLGAGQAFFPGLTGLVKHSILQATVSLQTPGTTKTQSYRVDGPVLCLPALAIQSISTTPSPVGIHHLFSVNLSIQEVQGDLGATFDVVLGSGNAVLNSLSVSVGPGGGWSGNLTTCFRALNTYPLTVKILKVNPTAFDPNSSDLQRTVTVTVVDAPLTATQGQSLVYTNSISRDLTVAKDLTLGGTVVTDDGEDSNVESLNHHSTFSSPLPFTGLSVYVVTNGVERLSECVLVGGKENPTKLLQNGNTLHSITFERFLTTDQTNYLRLDSSWETDSLNNVVTPYSGDMTVSHSAATHVYFSAANFFATGSTDPSTRVASGTLWQARSSFIADIRVFSADGKDYGNHLEQTSLDHTVADIPDLNAPPGSDTTVEIDKFGHEIETKNRSHSDTWSIFIQEPS